MKIVRAVQTLEACPSQWDAWTEGGQFLYLRYRFGKGEVYLVNGTSLNNDSVVVKSFLYGHPLDGEIDLEQFCEEAGIELELG